MLVAVLATAAAAAALLLATTRGASACGGFFCSFQRPVAQAGENILFTVNGGDIEATIQIQYSGEAEKFSWVLPLPSVPSAFNVSSDALFRALHQYTDPQFIVNVEHPKDCHDANQPCDFAFGGGGGGPLAASGGADDGVQTIDSGEVGPFVYTVIAALASDTKGEALVRYLRENGFDQPAESEAIIARYVRLRHKFVTLKLQKGKTAGELVPIVIRYAAPPDAPGLSCIPLRLTRVAATDDMPVFAWVAGATRTVPQNFVHITPDLRDLPWQRCASAGGWGGGGFGGGFVAFPPFGGANGCTDEYRELLKKTAEKYKAGKWVTTEFAGALPDGMLDAVWNKAQPAVKEAELRAAKDGGEFLQLLLRQLPFDLRIAAQTTELIKRQLPRPAAALSDDACKEDRDFWAPGTRNACLAKYGVTLDADSFVNELLDTLLKPLIRSRDELEKHAYLSRLFTMISPVNMVRDPVFAFAPESDTVLGDVSHVHRVNATYECPATRDDAFTVTFKHEGGGADTTVDGVKLGSCGGLQWPGTGSTEPIAWPPIVALGGRAEVMSLAAADGAGAGAAPSKVAVTAIADDTEYAERDAELEGIDFQMGAECTDGQLACACRSGATNRCDAPLVCGADNTCAADGVRPTTTNGAAAAVVASAGIALLAVLLVLVL